MHSFTRCNILIDVGDPRRDVNLPAACLAVITYYRWTDFPPCNAL